MPVPSPQDQPLRLTRARIAVGLSALALSACGAAASVGAPPKTVRVADYAAAATNPITVSPLPGTADA